MVFNPSLAPLNLTITTTLSDILLQSTGRSMPSSQRFARAGMPFSKKGAAMPNLLLSLKNSALFIIEADFG
jgi:hypothetical protein